jgi:hypothetical protein
VQVIAIALLSAVFCADDVENAGFGNCGFERGTDGWGVWYADEPTAAMTRYAWSADDAVAHSGKRSLRIEAPDSNGRAFVHRSSEKIQPGALYAVSYWFRKSPELDPKAFDIRFNCRPANPASPRQRMIAVNPLLTGTKSEGSWQQRSGYVRMPDAGPMRTQMGLYLQGARGTIWIDDVKIRPVPPEDKPLAGLWEYNPYRVDLGSAPVRTFDALKQAGHSILGRAARYNETLVRSAMVKEDVRRVQRLAHYDRKTDRAAVEELAVAMDAAEQDLAKLYRAYGEAFLDRENREKAAHFDESAAPLAAKLDALAGRAAAIVEAATKRCRTAGIQWSGPPEPPAPGLPAITSDGRVNQIIYAKRSLFQFQELEKPLGLDPVHSVSMGDAGTNEPGKYDWSGVDRQWDAVRAAGIAKRTCLATPLVVHDGCYAAPWLLEKAKTDPEILHVLSDGELYRRDHAVQVNWWHPEVKHYVTDLLRNLGRTFAPRDEFLFYVFQAECYGPYVSSSGGLREVGYGRRAEADFHEWLKRKYGTIDRLNGRWRTSHPSFDKVAPPADKYLRPRTHCGPLETEWEAWREQSYHDWRQFVYRTWKQADPNKPIVASHSQLFLRFSSPDEFDTCDLLGFHNRGADFMPVTLYLHSISRYNGFKPLAQYENFWGVQEDHDRMGEELACRHSAQKHVFRLTAWDRFLQVWWYAYTTADYLTVYDGNWLDPCYALTTLRYRSAGLPVCFAKFKRLQRALLESRIVPSRLCVLAPTASMRNNFPYEASQNEIRDLFWRLFPRNDLFELVPEEYLTDGRADLDQFDVLVLPVAPYLSEALQQRILAWLKGKPRLLIACGPCGTWDELGLDSRVLLDAVFPDRPRFRPPTPENPRWSLEPSGERGSREARVGESQVVLLLQNVCELDREALAKLVGRIEKAAPRPACDDANAFEMLVRVKGDTRYLCVLNNGVDDAAEGLVRVRGRFHSVVDLDYPAGLPVEATSNSDTTSFPLRLAPGEATIIRLEP